MGKYAKTWDAIHANPVRANIRRGDLVSLLRALGFEIETTMTGGSVRHFVRGDDPVLTLHEPHPGDELKRHAVRTVRDYLGRLGVSSDGL